MSPGFRRAVMAAEAVVDEFVTNARMGIAA